MTTMTVTVETRDRIAKLCVKNQPYEDIIKQALDIYEQSKTQ